MLRVRLQHSSVKGIKSMCSGVRAEHVNILKAVVYNLFMLLFSSKKCLEQGGDWDVRGTLGLHDKFGTRVMTDFCFPENELPKMHAWVMEARSWTWCVCVCVRACVVCACTRACLRASSGLCTVREFVFRTHLASTTVTLVFPTHSVTCGSLRIKLSCTWQYQRGNETHSVGITERIFLGGVVAFQTWCFRGYSFSYTPHQSHFNSKSNLL